MKIKYFNIPIYHGYLVVILSDDVNEVLKSVPLQAEEFYAHAVNYQFKGKEGYFVILNLNHSIPPSVIAHEAVHIGSMLFGNRGVVADFSNDEPFAYFVQWVVDRVMEVYE
jgi:hypothetical protein